MKKPLLRLFTTGTRVPVLFILYIFVIMLLVISYYLDLKK